MLISVIALKMVYSFGFATVLFGLLTVMFDDGVPVFVIPAVLLFLLLIISFLVFGIALIWGI